MTRMEEFALDEWLRKLEESITPRTRDLQKALNVVPGKMIKEGMAIPRVFERFPHLKEALEEGLQETVTLLLMDLSPFSSTVATWKPEVIKHFLDHYYQIAVDAIVQAGGVVEKYIGDAILAIFGPPFSSVASDVALSDALGVAAYLTETIRGVFDGELSCKTAISQGRCFLGYVGHDEHRELTVVGTPLTELFRLESICDTDSILLRRDLFDSVRHQYTILEPYYWRIRGIEINWEYSEYFSELRGVGTTRLSRLRRIVD